VATAGADDGWEKRTTRENKSCRRTRQEEKDSQPRNEITIPGMKGPNERRGGINRRSVWTKTGWSSKERAKPEDPLGSEI